MSNHGSHRRVTINAAFLQEIKEVNQELWNLLDTIEGLCEQPLSMRLHSRLLVDLLAKLRDHLAMHFSLEEAYGYFHEPHEPDPAVAGTASQLRGEHSDLYLGVSQLADHAENLWRERDDAALTTIVPAGVGQYLKRLKAHEAAETELIYRAMYEDIGVAD